MYKQPLTTSHLQTNVQPLYKQQLILKTCPLLPLQALVLNIMLYGTGHFFGQLQSAVSPFSLSLTMSLLAWGGNRGPNVVQAQFSSN